MTTNTQHIENQQPYDFREEETDYKKYLFIFIRKWYWFVLFGFLGFSITWFISQSSETVYSASSTAIIPQQNDGMNLNNIFEGGYYKRYTNITNQIEILKSYSLSNHVLENLGWRTAWYTKRKVEKQSITSVKKLSRQKITRYLKKVLIWKEIYPNDLFEVIEPVNSRNTNGILLTITLISDTTYAISAEESNITFETEGTFGKLFTNTWFNFILVKKPGAYLDQKYEFQFTFNDLNSQTMEYKNKLNVELKDDWSDVVQLSISGTEPRRSIEYLNELILVYTQDKLDRSTETQRRSIQFIDFQLAGIADSLREAGTTFSEFLANNQIINIGAEGERVMEKLDNIESELAKNRMQLRYFRNIQSYLYETGSEEQLVAPSVAGVEDPSLNTLVSKLNDFYSRREVLSFSAKKNNPTLIMLNTEIEQTRNQLKENLRNLIDNMSKVIEEQERQKMEINMELNRLPGKEQELINIQRSYDLTNEIYTFLLQKRAEYDIALASSVSDVQVIEAARMETVAQIGTSKSRKHLMGMLIGLAIPFFIILLYTYFDNIIRSRDDVEKNTQLSILGSVIHSEQKTELAISNSPRSGLAESYRSIRTNLQFMLTDPSQKVIAIHSTNPSEGKTFTAVNLATILAMNNHKVLLAGCDLRKPKLHRIFNTTNEKGVSTFLIGQDAFSQVILESAIENLWIAPAGPTPPNPSELLGKPEMKSFLKEAISQFDFIIIDNAPVAMITDGLLTGRLADLNLFVLRFGVSNVNMIQLINQLEKEKTMEHISLVLNDIKVKRFGDNYNYRYAHYYRYGSGYYEEEKRPGFLRRFFRRKHNG